jgi:FkbM family methyltransferase
MGEHKPRPARATATDDLEALIRPCGVETEALRAAMLRALIGMLDITCAIDVGANRGQTHDFLRGPVAFKGLIASFEPNPAAYRELAAKAKRDPLWLASPAALGPATGPRQFTIAKKDVLSSFLPSRDRGHAGASAVPVERKTVPMRRLDGVIENLRKRSGPHRFFVKLDTQGFDIEVMKGLSDRYLDGVPMVMSELSIRRRAYLGAPTYLQALRYFMGRGYRIAGFFNVISDKRYRAHEMDCLLVR